MKLQITCLLILLLFSCNNSNKNKLSNQSKHLIRGTDTTVLKNKSIKSENKHQKNLLGYWALKGEQNSTFVIGTDSIYYTDEFKSYKYKIIQDSIKIYYDDFIGTYKYRFKPNDTLVLVGDDGSQDYYRFSK
jgi:hypothetical protein